MTNISNTFGYTWNNVSGDTGVQTNDTILIMFNVTDIIGNSGKYYYSLIADFDKPLPDIFIGDGIQNFQDDLIANPETPINFNSNELVPPDPYYSWIDSLDSYDPSYMSHSYYPDNYNSTWSMNALNMYNLFPTSTKTENWINWNLNYDSEATTSSFNRGT